MAEIKKIKVDGVEYDIATGLYTQYFKLMIIGDDQQQHQFYISTDVFKPITNFEEFKDYIKNRILYSDTPNFLTTFLHFNSFNSTSPFYLAFGCAYYGSPSCQIDTIDSSGNVTNIKAPTTITNIFGSIVSFEVLATIKG